MYLVEKSNENFNGWKFFKTSKKENDSCWRQGGPFDHHIAEPHHMATSDNSIPYYYALYTPINCPPLMGNVTSKWSVIILDFVHYNTLQRIIMLTPDFRWFRDDILTETSGEFNFGFENRSENGSVASATRRITWWNLKWGSRWW